MNDDYSAQRVADRLAIQDVMLRWCRAVDRQDVEAIRDVFHPDGHDNHGPYSGGVDGLIEWVRARHKGIPFSSHQVSNMLIEFAGPDVAIAETYVRTIQTYPPEAHAKLAQLVGSNQQLPSGEVDMLTSSRYIDIFERRNGNWKIRERNVVNDWTRVVHVPVAAPPASGVAVRGRRDREDLLYRVRAKLGLGN